MAWDFMVNRRTKDVVSVEEIKGKYVVYEGGKEKRYETREEMEKDYRMPTERDKHGR